MAIICNNITVLSTGQVTKVENSPPPVGSKPVTDYKKLTENVVTQKPVPVQVIEEPVNKYKDMHEGDLHKMINTKSEYLRDMLALED